MISPSLPGGGADALDATWIQKDGLDLLERLVGRLGEQEEDVDEHGHQKDAEEDIHFPGDVDEGGRDEVGESEVHRPVGRGGQGDRLAADAEGIDLRRVDPRDGAPGGGE